MLIDIQQTKEAFFKAMLAGYVGDGEFLRSEDINDCGDKVFFWDGRLQVPELPFLVTDRYRVNKTSGKSAGETVIRSAEDNEPVWVMTYGGYYPADAIPFLKAVLVESYQSRVFYGGRGQWKFADSNHYPSYYYENGQIFSGGFEHFGGREKIFRNSQAYGWHDYSGMLLV